MERTTHTLNSGNEAAMGLQTAALGEEVGIWKQRIIQQVSDEQGAGLMEGG